MLLPVPLSFASATYLSSLPKPFHTLVASPFLTSPSFCRVSASAGLFFSSLPTSPCRSLDHLFSASALFCLRHQRHHHRKQVSKEDTAMATAAAASSPPFALPFFPRSAPPSLLFPIRLCFPRFSLPIPHLRRSTLPLSSRSMSSSSAPQQRLQENISNHAVLVYSKSWCPYCMRVKDLFKGLGVKPFVIELDELPDGDEVQIALQKFTGQYTVPNVFIGGKHIGGCDDTVSLHQMGKLIPLLKESGVTMP